MGHIARTNRFGGPPVDEVHLSRAPLVRVLTQVRWPQIASLKSGLRNAAEALTIGLAEDYPLLGEHHEMNVVLSPEGVTQQAGGTIYRFATADETRVVSFAETFLTLETTAYQSRDDFMHHFSRVLDSLKSVVSIPFWTRVGYRYTNRLTEVSDLQSLQALVDPAVLGGLQLKVDGPGISLSHSVSESLYRIGDTSLLSRAAVLGPGASIDPTLPPVDTNSWILDLDAFEESRSVGFAGEQVVAKASQLAEVAYEYFRTVTTSEFSKRFS